MGSIPFPPALGDVPKSQYPKPRIFASRSRDKDGDKAGIGRGETIGSAGSNSGLPNARGLVGLCSAMFPRPLVDADGKGSRPRSLRLGSCLCLGGELTLGPDKREPLPERRARLMRRVPGEIACRLAPGLGGRDDRRDDDGVVASLGEPVDGPFDSARFLGEPVFSASSSSEL